MGEITRNILLHFIDSSLLFGGYSSEVINTHYGYDTSFVSQVEGAQSDDEIKTILVKDLKVDVAHITAECIPIVRWAVHMVTTRAASLAACAIAAIVRHTGNDRAPEGVKDPGVDLGWDGR